MQTSNTAEMVTISRAEYEQLQQENAQLEAKSAKLEEAHTRLEAKLAAREQEQAQVITSLTLQNEWLLEQLKLSKKKLFGRSSEQAEQMVMEQLSFTYNEAEVYASGTKAAAEKPVAVKAHERKRQSGNVLDFRRGLALRWWSTVCRRMSGSALPAAANWLRSARMCAGRCR